MCICTVTVQSTVHGKVCADAFALVRDVCTRILHHCIIASLHALQPSGYVIL